MYFLLYWRLTVVTVKTKSTKIKKVITMIPEYVTADHDLSTGQYKSSLHSLEAEESLKLLSLVLRVSVESSMVARPVRLEYLPRRTASLSVRAPLSIIFSLFILMRCCLISLITLLCCFSWPSLSSALTVSGSPPPELLPRRVLMGSRVARLGQASCQADNLQLPPAPAPALGPRP